MRDCRALLRDTRLGQWLDSSLDRPLQFILDKPGQVLNAGAIAVGLAFAASLISGDWSWFPRGGAVLGLTGFMVSVREALLYRQPRPPRSRSGPGSAWSIRVSRLGTPVFHPDFGIRPPTDPSVTNEEIDSDRAARLAAWEDAEDPGDAEDSTSDEGDPGRPMAQLEDMSPEDLADLKLAALFGVVGTLIWAFGDLVGRL